MDVELSMRRSAVIHISNLIDRHNENRNITNHQSIIALSCSQSGCDARNVEFSLLCEAQNKRDYISLFVETCKALRANCSAVCEDPWKVLTRGAGEENEPVAHSGTNGTSGDVGLWS